MKYLRGIPRIVDIKCLSAKKEIYHLNIFRSFASSYNNYYIRLATIMYDAIMLVGARLSWQLWNKQTKFIRSTVLRLYWNFNTSSASRTSCNLIAILNAAYCLARKRTLNNFLLKLISFNDTLLSWESFIFYCRLFYISIV